MRATIEDAESVSATDVRLLSQTAGDLPDHVVELGPEAAVVVISFRRVDRAEFQLLNHARSWWSAWDCCA
jgi:hypothetical protein